ncbi:hypothetical protein [Streptomyces sp. NPDC005969]|uniref:hypothetical protein n=1 Tax=Streptomyces sp. NPDC005969 TaxID=3156722 RepID=UPI0033EFD17E
MTVSENRPGSWVRALVAVGLYISAIFWLALSLPFIGEKIGPTSDPDDVVGANFILLMSFLFLLAATLVSRRWKVAWLLCSILLVAIVIAWTQVPSLITYWDFKGPCHSPSGNC